MSEPGEGVDSGADTIDASDLAAETEPSAVDVAAHGALERGFERYEIRGLLGAGGMGEVQQCSDTTIGRDVAMKIVRDIGGDASDEVRRRFEREARIQGQLEHPGIVPVYDLGNRPDGVAYFTMKQVRGKTLAEVIAGLRAGDPAVEAEFPRRRLLLAFGSACLAVAYANARGVVHRDLKPANIILGRFGEVYILDWGIAKVVGEAGQGFFASGAATPEQATQVGELLGTPGYMAPEQVRGELELDARADVYSLGMILFELLALERFHRGETIDALLSSAIESGPARPAERAPDRDVPLDLDDLCAAATAPDPADRLGSARELHDRLEHFLIGEQDAAHRHELAARHVESAEAALASGRDDPEHDIESRSRAIRELVAALSLEPDNHAAGQALVRALTEESAELPAAAVRELAEQRSAQRRRAARNACIALAAMFATVPLVVWNGVRDWTWLGVVIGMLGLSTATAFILSRKRHIPPAAYLTMMVVLACFTATASELFGPLFLTPTLALAFATALMAGARLEMRHRAVVIALGAAGVLVPAAIQWLRGSWTYVLGPDGLLVTPSVLELSSDRTLLLLAVFAATAVVVPSMLVGRSVAVLHKAEERQFAQAWRLRQIFPDDLRGMRGVSRRRRWV